MRKQVRDRGNAEHAFTTSYANFDWVSQITPFQDGSDSALKKIEFRGFIAVRSP
ncbi:hypothetical protein NOVOSPHI9U_210011 [Novosphingobium sp. 9U]|nr:hypothetical protein NOVOSPHI9U_210011 [Novosphingobium sp. 9U]